MRTCATCGSDNDGAATRCASCGASLAATPPASRAAPASPPSPALPAVVASLTPAILAVEPGGTGEAALEIRNTAAIPATVTIEVIGDAAPWAAVDPRALDVAAGATAVVAVRVRPPGDAGPVGTSVDVGFVVRSAEQPDTAAVELAVVELRPPAAPSTSVPATPAAPAALLPATPAAPAAPEPAVERVTVPPASTRPARSLAVVGLVGLVAVVAVAAVAVLGGGLAAPGASPSATPAAVATPSVPPVATPTPGPTPTATPTPPPPTPTPGPDAPAAWWQDAWDAAALQGAALGALVAEGTTDDGLPFATFADGAVYQRVTDAFSMSGAIWRAWVERGGGAGPAPGLGFPASGVLGPDPGHRRQLFDDGAIYWTEPTGAHAVHGEVWAWWRQLVRDRGGDVELPGDSGLVAPLGYPVGDVRLDAGGTWIDLEAGRIGVRTDGTRWACSAATPPAGFPACAVVDPRP